MRSKKSEKRVIKPDFVYNNLDVAKFIREIMVDGKINIANKICYTSLKNAADFLKVDVLEMFEKVLTNIEPTVILVSKKIGGALYQLPKPVDKSKRRKIALFNLKKFAFKVKGKSMIEKLTSKLIECYNNTGDVVKEKERLHKLAESNDNKVFSSLG